MNDATNNDRPSRTFRQFCTFHVGELFLGIDVLKVQEVIRYQAMTPVPLAAPEVSGLINLRGRIVTAIDLRRRIGLPDRPADRLPMNVVLGDSGDGATAAVSLLVDEIGDVLDVDARAFERPPETLRGIAQDLISGVYKLDRKLLVILDTDRAVQLNAAA